MESNPLPVPVVSRITSSSRWIPFSSLRLVNARASTFANGFASSANPRMSLMTGSAAGSASLPVSARLPSVTKVGSAASLNGPSCSKIVLTDGAAARRSVMTGVPAAANSPRRRIVGRSCVRKAGNFAKFCSSASPREAVAVAVAPALSMKSLIDWLSRAAGASAASDSTREVRQHAVLRGEDREHSVELVERRVRAADHRVELLAVARQPDAELVDDDREALALRQPHDVVQHVEVDRAPTCSTPAAGTPPCRRRA